MSIVALLALLFCCKTTSSKVEHDELLSTANVEAIAQIEFEENYLIEQNENGNYSIVSKKNKKFKDLFPEIHYFIYDHKAQKIIFRDQLKAGHVAWQSKFMIKAIARNLEDENKASVKRKRIYTYDVRSGEQVDL